jgi:hypothetical protein
MIENLHNDSFRKEILDRNLTMVQRIADQCNAGVRQAKADL